jgi:methionine synthase I (cobalamin-dependent)
VKSVPGRLLALVALMLLALSPAAPARAHVVEAGADLRVTQTFGAGEVTLVITGVSQVPAQVRVSAHSAHRTSVELERAALADRRADVDRFGARRAGARCIAGGPRRAT